MTTTSNQRIWGWAVACLALVLYGPAAFAEEAEWTVGIAQVKITPIQPVLMSGYAGRTKPFEGVTADLYVKAMVLQDSTGRRSAIVTSDLLGFPAAVAEPICERIQKKIGLKREEVLLNSAHTHAGPQLSLKLPLNGAGGEALRTLEYTRQLQDKVVGVVVQAAERLEPARLSWGSGVIHFAMNRREFTPTGIILGVNPRGLADRSVPVLRIDSPDGTARAVLFGAAVHGTTLGADNFQVCGDYAGFAQTYIEEKLPKVQAMFMLGCAGDANPYPRGTMDLARQHGKALGDEVCRVLAGKLRPVKGPLQIAFGRADLPLASVPRADLEKFANDKRNPKSFAAKQSLALLDKGEKLPTHYSCPLTVWQFGQDLTLVGLSGEVVVDYVTLLEKALGPNQLWVAAYCNDVFGYLPSIRVLSEGGYETRGLYSGGAGWFVPEAEQVVLQKVRELARKAGRVLPGQSGQSITKREIIAHRGSSIDRPENTLASYRRAIDVGATATECDVRTTKEGVPVSLHDADVSRTSNGKGLVSDMTLANLKRFDFGSWFDPKYKGERIPTVQEILELCHGKIDVMLDLKESGQPYAEKVAALVRNYGEPKRTILGVRSAEQARRFRKLLPESRQIGLIPTPKDIPAFAEAGVETIRLWPKWLADKSLVEQVRKHKKQLHLGTGKGTIDEVLPLLTFKPESLSSDDPRRLIQTLTEISWRKD